MSQITMRPITPFGDIPRLTDVSTDPLQIIEDQYFTLRERCIEQYGEDRCNAFLPRSMIYAVTRRDQGYSFPWWAWMILGALAAKVIT